MRRHTVCLNCEKRAVGCHSRCERYAEESAEVAKEKAEIRKKKEADWQFLDYRRSRDKHIRIAARNKRGGK